MGVQFEASYIACPALSPSCPNARIAFSLPWVQRMRERLRHHQEPFDVDTVASIRTEMSHEVVDWVSRANTDVRNKCKTIPPHFSPDSTLAYCRCETSMLATDIVSHSLSCWKVVGGSSWLDKWNFDPHATAMASYILDAFDLNWQQANVKRFACQCGNPTFVNPCHLGNLVSVVICCTEMRHLC